jgi:hypothetical protein
VSVVLMSGNGDVCVLLVGKDQGAAVGTSQRIALLVETKHGIGASAIYLSVARLPALDCHWPGI